MSIFGPARHSLDNKTRSRALALAVMTVLTTPGLAHAQTIPHQSGQRGNIGTGLGQSSLPSGGVFEPRVEAAVQYVSNINLAENGASQIDTAGLEVSPGFYASYSSGSALAAIDYSLIGRAWDESDFNDVSHRLAANGEWMAIPEWFALRGDASYQDAVIDPAAGLNYGGVGIFGPSNLQEVATASVNPVLQHRFNDYQLSADYRYGRTWYLDEGKGQVTTVSSIYEDSTDQSANVSFGTADTGSRLWGTAFYSWNKSEYDETLLPFEYEQAGVDVGVQVLRTIALVGSYGLETDLSKRLTDGGLDEQFWDAGVIWTPNDNTSVEARYGDRSFGETYSFKATHRARMLEFTAGYVEEPTVDTQRLSLGDIFPGELPPGVPDIDLGIYNSLPYILRRGDARIAALGSRTRLGVSAFWYERDYLISAQSDDESGEGIAFDASRDLASNLTADFDLSFSNYERTNAVSNAPASDYSDIEALFRLNRVSGPHLTLSAETGYLTRSGDSDYDGWWVAMRARWTP